MTLHPEEESIGTLIANRYQICKVLAKGGMSMLFSGKDVCSSQPIAIKRLRNREQDEINNLKRFQQEIETATRLSHPNIVKVLDSGTDEEGFPYLIMELLHGTSLDVELSEHRRFGVKQVIEWLLPLFGALSYAHDYGIVHRDIKPANIFLCRSEDGQITPKLLDFGISMVTNASRFTRSGTVVGTVHYMSPEQANDGSVGPATDVWAMGVVLFHCLTGKLPFDASTAASVLYKIVNEPAPKLISIVDGMGPKFGAALDRALTKESFRRYSDMRNFARALCLSAQFDGISLPASPDPIGLPDWPKWHLGEVPEGCETDEIVSESLPTDQSRKNSLSTTVTIVKPNRKNKGFSRYVGRQRETERLLEAYRQATVGSRQVVGIVGEAGVGKTRLLREMRNRIDSRKYLYLEGDCQQQVGSFQSYFPILQLLRRYFRLKEGEEPIQVKRVLAEQVLKLDRSLQDSLPILNDLFLMDAVDEQSNPPGKSESERLRWQTIQRLFIRMSQKKPLIIAIEDLQWLDRSSQEFVDFFIHSFDNAPILLVLLYRYEYQNKWKHLAHHTEIELNRLDVQDSAELLRSILDQDVAVDLGLQDLIWRCAQGNPFYIEEYTNTLLETATIQKGNRGFLLDTSVSPIPIASNIQEIIGVRMDLLEQTVKQTLQMASVIGPDHISGILQRISGMRDELDAHFRSLEHMQFICEKSVYEESSFVFKHALIQQAAYESISEENRKVIHDKTASALEEAYGPNLQDFYETLAYHHLHAANWDKACHYSRLAGEKASRNYNYETAIQFYQQAISVLDNLPESEDIHRRQLDIRFLMNAPYLVQGYPPSSLGNMQEMERLSKVIGDSRSLAMSYCMLNGFYSQSGNQKKSSAFAELAIEEALKVGDVEIVAPLAGHLFLNYSSTSEFYKIEAISPSIIELLEKTGRTSDAFNFLFLVYPWICAGYGNSLALGGKFDQGKHFTDNAYIVASRENHLPTLALIEVCYAIQYKLRGQAILCIEHANKSIEFMKRADWLSEMPVALTQLGYGLYFLGDLPAAKEVLESACANQADSLVDVIRFEPFLASSFVSSDLGRYDEALRLAEKSFAVAKEAGDGLGQAMSIAQKGMALGQFDPSQFVHAEELIDNAKKMTDQLKLHTLSTLRAFALGRLYTDTGRKKRAMERLEELNKSIEEMDRMGMGFWLEKARVYLAKVLE